MFNRKEWKNKETVVTHGTAYVQKKLSNYSFEPKQVAKAIVEGPQKKVLANLSRINSRWIQPIRLYPLRGNLPKLKPLGVTEKFNWKRGYRDTILSAIEDRFNQYKKSSATLNVLLSSRPNRMHHEKHDFERSVIEVDSMLRVLRKNKISFAENGILFEKIWNGYFDNLKSQFNQFEKDLKDIDINMHFKWYLQAPDRLKYNYIDKRNSQIDDYFRDSFLCYELYWNDTKIPVINNEGAHIQDIPVGDMIFKWNIRLLPLMKELMRQHYKTHQLSSESGLDIDVNNEEFNLNDSVQHMEYKYIERYTTPGNDEMFGYRPHGDQDRDHILYNQREGRKIGLQSSAIMANSTNSSILYNRYQHLQSDDLLNYPYIARKRQPSRGNGVMDWARAEYVGNWEDEATIYKEHSGTRLNQTTPQPLQDICWGDCHRDMWNSIIKLNFMELVFTIKHWNRYTIPGANPLNNVRHLHWGMPANYSESYKHRISQDPSWCAKAQCQSVNAKGCNSLLNLDTIQETENTTYLDDQLIPFLADDENLLDGIRDKELSKLIEVVSYCDSIKCTLRKNSCSFYENRSGKLNTLLKTTEEPLPFGEDIYKIVNESVEESLPFSEDVQHEYSENEINTIESEQQMTSEEEDMREQMRTWFVARGGRGNIA